MKTLVFSFTIALMVGCLQPTPIPTTAPTKQVQDTPIPNTASPVSTPREIQTPARPPAVAVAPAPTPNIPATVSAQVSATITAMVGAGTLPTSPPQPTGAPYPQEYYIPIPESARGPQPTAPVTPQPTPTLAPSPTPALALPTGKWRVLTSIDHVSGNSATGASLVSHRLVNDRGNNFKLVVGCLNHAPISAYIETYQDFNDGLTTVVTRTDANPPVSSIWGVNSSSEILPGDSMSFVESLIGSEQLTVEITPYPYHSVTAYFDVKGSDVALGPVLDECG